MKKNQVTSLLAVGTLLLAAFPIACTKKDETVAPVTGPTAPVVPTSPEKPAPPSGLVNVANIRLAFVDHANNEDGFRVYQNGGLQMTLAPNVVEFTPTTCIGGFKVTAYNVGGESSSTNTVICHSGS